MRIEEPGARIEGGNTIETVAGGLNPQSSILNPEAKRRLRWRCRRGLLELDIVLGRFVEQGYAALDHEQRVIFDELLDMPDTQLWGVITGTEALAHPGQRAVVERLKAS